jgi:hypothetical protein
MIKSRRIKWMRHVTCIENKINVYKSFVRTTDEKGLLGISRFKIDMNVKIAIGEVGREGVDWIQLAQDRDQWQVLINTVMNLHSEMLRPF